MSRNISFLGWGALDLHLGDSISGDQQWSRLQLDWQPGDIRNCSYAPQPDWIGITAEDRGQGRQVLAVYERASASTRVLLREDYLLHHSLNSSGSKVCYTIPSAQRGAADLFLYEEGGVRRLAEGIVSQSSVPVWFPDETRLAYHSPDGQIEVFDSTQGQRERLVEGESPAISPNGEQIAFRRDNQLFIWHQADREARALEVRGGLLKRHLTDGISWSPDGRHLSFGRVSGFTGKQTTFYLLNLADGSEREITAEYLRGLLIVGNLD